MTGDTGYQTREMMDMIEKYNADMRQKNEDSEKEKGYERKSASSNKEEKEGSSKKNPYNLKEKK